MDEDRRLRLLDLPAEILSQIASYLPLSQILPFLSLHPLLLSLTQTHLSPLPTLISHALDRGPPYAPTLAVLPSLTLYQPDDGGRMWVDTLVRARAKWILERMEMGRWRDTMWKEAFERRFLPSWKRYKGEGDSWRALFIRVLGRLEHRHLGCTHEESWTRFVTLHRNGAASINRIYSRLFDPYDIYEELKHQNNFASAATHVRVVLHLSDVRILAIGVLHDQPSLFVNPNAHLLLHPPLLRRLSRPPTRSVPQMTDSRYSATSTAPIAIASRGPAAATPSHNANEIYYPVVRSMSPSGPLSTSYGLGEGSPATSPAERSSHPPQSQSSRRTTLSSLLPSLGRRTSATVDTGDDAMVGTSGTSPVGGSARCSRR
ncbi:hypothetical protein EHS25_007589 [Saitozyma podzolica]|uniref:F-box domain-containing protein n=1 Tax=Saitozyma podzolica TaxID=1890683 RepID=A0A427YQ88_9TREE|nr:hypothetical protein EHS25_007589 [Saitozyma podzolica]